MKLHELDEPKWDYVMWCVEKQNVGRYLRFFWGWGEHGWWRPWASMNVMFGLQQATLFDMQSELWLVGWTMDSVNYLVWPHLALLRRRTRAVKGDLCSWRACILTQNTVKSAVTEMSARSTLSRLQLTLGWQGQWLVANPFLGTQSVWP